MSSRRQAAGSHCPPGEPEFRRPATDRTAWRIFLVGQGGGMDLDEALTAVVSRDGDRLLRVGFQLTHDRAAAQDLVQGALLRVYSAVRRGGREPRDWYAYLRRAVINEYLRTRRLRSGTEVVADPVPEAPPAESAEGRVDDRAEVWAALGELSARQRAVLVLRATTRACRTGRSRPCSAAG